MAEWKIATKENKLSENRLIFHNYTAIRQNLFSESTTTKYDHLPQVILSTKDS